MDIRFKNVTFRYRARQRPVLEGLDLDISAGRTILLGPNGAGKSTLLGLAGSVLRVSDGDVEIGGTSARSRKGRRDYRRRVAWMPQSVQAASGLTVREQVAAHAWLAGLSKAEAWDNAMDALVQVDLVDHAQRRASQLSGGQRARMGLAQALAQHAEVLLLDEPTAALDPDQKQSFAHLLRAVSPGRTIVVSTHDVSDLEDSYDRVIVLDAGRVRFHGSTGQFLRANDVELSPVDAYRAAMGAV